MTKGTSTVDAFVEVVVTVENHTHDGQPVAKGDVIRVSADVATWMTSQKIARPAPTFTARQESEK